MTLPLMWEQYVNSNTSTTLTQTSSIFTVGTGKNSSNVDIDISSSVIKGPFSNLTLLGSTATPYNLNRWRRCNLADNGTVLAYYGDANYKEDGSNGQVMVEIHKAYARTIFENNRRIDLLSETPAGGYEVHPAFVRNGIVKEKIYFSAFGGCIQKADGTYLLNDEQTAVFTAGTGDKLASIAGAKPCSGHTQNLTIVNSRILARNRGAGWEQQDFWTSSLIQAAMAIELGKFDTQTVYAGVTNINDTTAGNTLNNAVITGLTASLGNASGEVNYTYNYPNATSVITKPFSFHGIENFYGNIWKWVDGININNNVPFVADYNFQSDKFTDNYKNLGITLLNVDGWVEDFANIPYTFLPSKTGANKIGNYYYQASGAQVALLGGSWLNGSYAGVAYWSLSTSSGYRYRYIGARLLYVPQN
jgi:hypothetical protein